ncbi:hypothetical protein DJ568_07850 [Mucilaginibacter hurinus]|uniref:PDZ domain-containing protein n=1 Tax=Mucilaginibacter hurinus TaxID=2201324 RepID=A0A367GQF4_9SPHI|nr:S41 family peptidase [Mucilaginibacter hurinus]RCH55096.1 hypothetical protein DJ568_07850 [Mucilaginibacter hurinus]
MKKNLYVFALLVAAVVSACKKNNPAPDVDDVDKDQIPATGTRVQKIKDSIFLHAKESYLWYDAVPAYGKFKPRSFNGSTEIAALQAEIDALSQYKINPSTGNPFEYYKLQPGLSKYSFIDDGATSGELGGEGKDYGMEPRYADNQNVYVKYVYAGSPADNAGIKRGDKIIKLNGHTEWDDDVEANVTALIDAFYYRNTMEITWQRSDGTIHEAKLVESAYPINPVLTYKVINTGEKKVGYIVFNSFTEKDRNAKPKLDQAFDHFISKGVTDLVVDLRYNGGGYSNTSDYLANLIVPPAKDGALMTTDIFNANLQAGKFPLLNERAFNNEVPLDAFKPEYNRVYFDKQKTLSPQKVVFIVTGGTASASESVINNLLPHMDVKIVGERTYGKPVGFWRINLDKYHLYLVQVAGQNSLGKSEFYEGMLPGSPEFPGRLTFEDVTKDFGDISETSLAAALTYINTGSFPAPATDSKRMAGKRMQSIAEFRELGLKVDKHRRFRGTIFNVPK